MAMQTQQQPILIKCYAGARLYDPAAARYVTIEQLRRWKQSCLVQRDRCQDGDAGRINGRRRPRRCWHMACCRPGAGDITALEAGSGETSR
jgi:hypothetical protein